MPSREIFQKGYSPPKCTCNGTPHIQVKTCTFLLKYLHVMDENVTHPILYPESSPTPSHMHMPNVKTCHWCFTQCPFIQNKRLFVFINQILWTTSENRFIQSPWTVSDRGQSPNLGQSLILDNLQPWKVSDNNCIHKLWTISDNRFISKALDSLR